MSSAEMTSEAAAYVSLRRTQNRYGDIVTRRAFDELRNVMVENCDLSLALGNRDLHIIGREEIGLFIADAVERFSFFHFVILNAVADIDVEKRTARSRMYVSEIRVGRDDGRRWDTFGVYHDDLEADDGGRWRFASRRYQSMSRSGDPDGWIEQLVFDVDYEPLGDAF